MKLLLDESHKPFRPGETIVGQVELGADEGSTTHQVHLILEGRAKSKTREFQRPERELARTAHLLSFQTARLLANDTADEASKPTFKQRWRKVVRPDKVPRVNFKAVLEISKSLRTGEQVLISLQLEPGISTSVINASNDEHSSISLPDVQIDMLELNIKHTTQVRTCGSLKKHLDSWSETVWTEKQIHGLAGTVLPLWSGVASTLELASSTLIPSRLTPTFATYNISRSYFIRVTVSMTVAGKQKFINHSAPIDIYPAADKATRQAERIDSGLSCQGQSAEDWGELISTPH